MISYNDLIKKHYILQTKRINPFKAEKSFTPFEGFGIECGEGWYNLLDELCTKIETELNRTNNSKEEYPFSISQIKEKFGGLRFYVNGANDIVYDLISEYEKKSYETCDVCGEEGRTYEIRMWYITLCRKHVTPALMKWKVDTIKDIEKCEADIKRLVVIDTLSDEEQKELDEATEWLQIGKNSLGRITKQLNNEVAE